MLYPLLASNKERRLMNEFNITGVVINKPECVTSESGCTYANVLLKAKRTYKNKDGEVENDEFQCSIFNKSANEFCELVKKGSPLLVKGHITTNKNTGKEGKVFYSNNLVIDRYELLSEI